MFDQSRGGERVWFKARIYTQRIAVHKTCREAHLLRLHNPGSQSASVEVTWPTRLETRILFDRLYIQSDNSLRRKIKWLKKNTRKILRTVFFFYECQIYLQSCAFGCHRGQNNMFCGCRIVTHFCCLFLYIYIISRNKRNLGRNQYGMLRCLYSLNALIRRSVANRPKLLCIIVSKPSKL